MKLIIDIPGGFGNQLFGYAFGYALSREMDCKYYIHTPFQDSGISWNLQLNYFNIKYDGQLTYSWTKKFFDRALGNKLRRRKFIGVGTSIARENEEWELDDYVKILKKKRNVMFYGNWENEKFFKKYRADILEMLTLKESRTDDVEMLIHNINRDKKTVGIHVRRGDKVAMGASLSAQYYNNALAEMNRQLCNDAKFYIVSDDIKWCKEYLHCDGATLIYPEFKSDNRTLDDWLILKACNHHIVANSTFSWWAAWLCESMDQVVICPKGMTYKLDKWIGM